MDNHSIPNCNGSSWVDYCMYWDKRKSKVASGRNRQKYCLKNDGDVLSDHQPDRSITASILLRLTEDDDNQYDVVAAGSMVLLLCCFVCRDSRDTQGHSGILRDTQGHSGTLRDTQGHSGTLACECP